MAAEYQTGRKKSEGEKKVDISLNLCSKFIKKSELCGDVSQDLAYRFSKFFVDIKIQTVT